MNNKEQKELQKDWLLVALAAILGFFVNLVASATYDMYISGFVWKKFLIFIISIVFSIFIIGFFTYIFENLGELRKNKSQNSFWLLIKQYIKSIFKKEEKEVSE